MGVAAGVWVDVAGHTATARVVAARRASRFTTTGLLCGPAQPIIADSSHLLACIGPS